MKLQELSHTNIYFPKMVRHDVLFPQLIFLIAGWEVREER